MTKIAWTEETWNPTTGCSKVSEGCRFCYAEALSLRRGWSQQPWTLANAKENVVLHPERLRKPYNWREPRRVFVNSMSDLFHEAIPDAFVVDVFRVMGECPRHTFQVLTKRPERAATWPGPWTPNIWMGTSVENRKAVARLDALRRCGAAIRFVSFEPLLEDLGPLDLTGMHWVIIGGESGPTYRPMDHAWARSIRDQATAHGAAVFFKQSAAHLPGRGTRLQERDGSERAWQEYPDAAVAALRELVGAGARR